MEFLEVAYNEGSGILACRSLFTIVYADMRKLEKKNELPADELEIYRTLKQCYAVAICCIAIALLVWIVAAIRAVLWCYFLQKIIGPMFFFT